jgi:hypothetical protein
MNLRVICHNNFLLTLIVMLLLSSSPALLAQDAPVTIAGRVTDAIPGDTVSPLPVIIHNFNNIGQFTLTLKFDTTRVKYISSLTNPLLQGMTADYTPPSGNSQGKLVLTWTGTENISLADSSSLADITFFYVNGTGLLNWSYTFGSVCRYKRYSGGVLITMTDSPKNEYYQDGGIADRTSPVITAPTIAGPEPGPVPLAFYADEFVDIKSFTLYLEYDPAIIAYQNSFTKNPAFDSNFIVGDSPGVGDMRMIIMQWFSFTPVSLPDGSLICTLDFNYLSATCDPCVLGWYDTGPTCEYADGEGHVLMDVPKVDFYHDGIIAPGSPATWTGNAGSDWHNASNWDSCGIPDIMRNVVIPDVSPLPFPVISSAVDCHSLTVEEGAMITISSSGSLIIGE